MNKQLDMTKYVGQKIGGYLNKQTDRQLVEKALLVTLIVWIAVIIVRTIRV